MKDSDRLFLLAAIELAKKGLMTVAPNPPVGCLIHKHGYIIGRGYHEKAGEGHAEINALSSVSELVSVSPAWSVAPAGASSLLVVCELDGEL